MAKYRFKTEIFSPRLAELTEKQLTSKEFEGADEALIKGLSHFAADIPLVPMLFSGLMNIYQGGYAQEITRWGAKVYRPSRLPPEAVVRLWRRGLLEDIGMPEAFDDLADQGWSDERINAIIRATEHVPSPQDLVSFLAHEVFEPDMIDKYHLDDEWKDIDKSVFEQIGMPVEFARMYWLNHWQHPSFTQIVEARRRNLLTDQDIWDWFRLVEIPPYWRDMLIKLVWEIPTRVDVRRWYDMGTITESELSEIYQRQGYHGDDNKNYVLWTKVYVAFPDLVARYKNGWITPEGVIAELISLGMPEAKANELFQTKISKAAVERVAKERDLTLTQIYKGVKVNKIERPDALDLIMGLGYDKAESSLLLDIYAPEDETASAAKARELTKSDVKAALKVGELNESQALEKLLELRYTPEDANILLNIFKAVNNPPEEAIQRQLTRADITDGVTKGLLTPKEGYESLLEMGFEPEDADYILALKAETSPFSPRTLSEFRALVNKYRECVGLDYTEATDAAIEAEQSLIRAKADLEAAQYRLAPQNELAVYEALLKEAQIKFERAIHFEGE